MSLEAAFASSALDKISDQISDAKHLSNESYERRDNGIDPSDRSSERFSDTMRKESERVDHNNSNDQVDHDDTTQPTKDVEKSDAADSKDANSDTEKKVEGLEVAEMAELGLITLETPSDEIPTIHINFDQTQTQDAAQNNTLLNNNGEAIAVDTEVEQVLNNGVQAAAVQGAQTLAPTTEDAAGTGVAISSLEAETAESLMPSTADAELDQDGQLPQQKQQSTVNPLMQQSQQTAVQNTENSEGEAEQHVQQVQQTSNTNTQNTTNIVGSDQGKIQIQDFQSVMNNQKVDGATQTTAQQDLNAMDKAVGKQIERAVVQQLQNGQKVLQIRLTPPELGTVKVEILEQSGRMTVRLQAEDESVRMSLEKALPQLRGDLRASSAPIADVQLTDHSFLMNQHRQAQHQQQQRRRQQQGQSFELEGAQAPEQKPEQQQGPSGVTINSRGVNGTV